MKEYCLKYVEDKDEQLYLYIDKSKFHYEILH